MKLRWIEFYLDYYDTHAIAFFTSPMISKEAHGGTREAQGKYEYIYVLNYII